MTKILFEDIFDYEGAPDKTKWNLEIGGHGWGNKELQYYSDSLSNAYVENHKLIIKAQKETTTSIYKNQPIINHYTSAKLTTYKKFSFKYGSIRICCKLPNEIGLWPAIWLLPNSYKEGNYWPKCGEIDILENVTSEKGRLVYSLHSEKYNFRRNNQISKVVFADVTDKFIEYRMDWTRDFFEYYLDGKKVARIDRPKDAKADEWPFDEEFYLIINLAVGGSWPGNPSENFMSDKFEIKYIRLVEI